MDERGFWDLIEGARADAGGDLATQCRLLEDRLAARPPGEIVAWDAYLEAWKRALELEKLWAACALIGMSCSDDGFEDFKAWIIAHGRDAALAAMRDPDSLAAHLPAHAEAEGLSVAWAAYERAAGRRPPLEIPGVSVDAPDVDDWDFDVEDDEDEVARRLPRIAAIARG